MNVLFLLGSQLFHPENIRALERKNSIQFNKIILIESKRISSKYRYHKIKLAFMWASMRAYKEELESHDFSVEYHHLSANKEWQDVLNKNMHVHVFEFSDKSPREAMLKLSKKIGFNFSIHENPMFLTQKDLFSAWAKDKKIIRFHQFYAWQRKRLSILMDKDKPIGGKWSFDIENRKKLPKNMQPPDLPQISLSQLTNSAIQDVEKYFPKNPGSIDKFWLPVTRKEAQTWFSKFLKERLQYFGAYEDAITKKSPFVYHSAISACMNIGLLSPQDVVNQSLEHWHNHHDEIPFASIEGFLRQIIGWREYMKGIYELAPEKSSWPNHWKHKNLLPETFYTAQTNIPPLDDTIHKVLDYAYAHHIERLMILSNYMLLNEYQPLSIFNWFMELFVDAYEWVMYGNVYSMGQYADGGLFTTKPYISSSNYIRKMSDYQEGPWSKEWDRLFWNFIKKHKALFEKQPRFRLLLHNKKI